MIILSLNMIKHIIKN